MKSNYLSSENQTRFVNLPKSIQPMKRLLTLSLLGVMFLVSSCTDGFDALNDNPNQPTDVGAEAVLPGAIRSSVNASVNMSFLVGNNISQLSAKTLRKEVDIYQWNSFNNFVWDPLFESLRDIEGLHALGEAENNEGYQAIALILRSWVYSILTDAYGDIPYTEAIAADTDVLFPSYDTQEEIYLNASTGLIAQLEQAASLLEGSSATVSGDILFGGDLDKWHRLANALQLRLWLRVSDKVPGQAAPALSTLASKPLMRDASDGALLSYLSVAPNQFPTYPLKLGDFDAVNISSRLVDSLSNWNDPRLEIYSRPANAPVASGEESVYSGLVNGAISGGGSRLGYRYYDYPGHATSDQMAKGIIMTHAEQEFILAEAAERDMISADASEHYTNGVLSSMVQYDAPSLFPYTSVTGQLLETPADYLVQASVDYASAEDKLERIASQKWVALFFTGLEPWFDWRRTGRPAMEPALNNENGNSVPVRFRYPGDELTLNTANYQDAVSRLQGGDTINSEMWLVQ